MNLKLLHTKLNRSGDKAIYIQIADLIIESIKSGVLKAGETMPSTRHMAAELSVNRNTVVLAFDILINEGWIISEERKKTYVSNKIQISQVSKRKNLKFNQVRYSETI